MPHVPLVFDSGGHDISVAFEVKFQRSQAIVGNRSIHKEPYDTVDSTS